MHCIHRALGITQRNSISKFSIPATPLATSKRLYTSSAASSIDDATDIPSPQIPLPDNAKRLTLSDGRKMGYAEYGSPSGHPFIFIHGIPDCRIDCTATPKDEALMKKLNIRWIGIDRPGIGLSSPQPNRTILDWTKDLQNLVDYLKLDTYRIFSVSGGTGHALACAKVLPREQLRSVGIMVGVGPWEAGLKGTSLRNWIGLHLWKRIPWFMEAVYDRSLVPTLLDPDRTKTVAMIEKQAESLSGDDKKFFSDPENIETLTTIFKEVYRQGSARGHAEDMKLAMNHWGFELEDVKYDKIRLWYGLKDVNTPPEHGRYMAARLPGSILKEYEGKSHFSMWDHAEEALTSMLEDK